MSPLNPTPAPRSPGARALALDILARAERQNLSVEDLLAAAFRRHPELPRAERALLTELVQGVKRWQLRLDYVLSQVSDLPLKKLHPLVLQILRLGAFQLLLLTRVPARAAVHEAGELAKAHRLPKAHAGFINAVLRRLARGEGPALPAAASDPVLALSVEYSHPGWLVKRWLERYGPELTRARLAADNQIPPLTIRLNSLKTDAATLTARLAREGVTAAPCRYAPGALQLTALKTSPLELASYREGLWLFQDEAAQLVSLLLPGAPGQRWLEIGAGRGGKTTHLAELMGNRGLLLAADYHGGRLKELKANLARWGIKTAQPLTADAAAGLPVRKSSMEAVVLDAPCSGLGVLRRHPEVKTRLQEADLATFPPRQRALLSSAAAVLKPGGHLLYITCTTEPAENEAMIEGFLAAQPQFRLADAAAHLPAPAARDLVQPPGYFRTSPEAHNLDAFFAALLVREG